MSDAAFLKKFITEDIYVIGSTDSVQTSVQEPLAEYKTEADKETDESEVSKITIKFKGGNGKGVAILVNYPANEFIDSQDEAFLLKILSAVKLTVEDVAIFNLAKMNGFTSDDLKSLDAKTYLIFDESSDLIQTITKYQVAEHNGITVLWSSPLSNISNDNEQKKLLWESLQKLFLQ